MADDDANLPPDYDLVPVDHTPQFSDAPVPKAGQTVQQPNVMGDISSMPGKVASAVGDVTGVSDAYKAATGQMTPEEAQMFALGALPMLAGGPEAKAVGEVASDIAPEVAKGIRAFHGSPYDFNQFDLSKIGTGEGAQAYGHGLYFAENPGTAQAYRDSLSDLKPRSIEGNPDLTLPSWIAKKVESKNPVAINDVRTDFQNRLAEMQRQVADPNTPQPWMVEANIPGIKNILTALDHVEGGANVAPAGRMYEVNINADPDHFLDWDKSLSEQHPKVQEALQSLDHPVTQAWQTNGAWPHATGQNLYDAIGAGRTNAAVSTGKTQAATEQLRDAGIPGIKYLDQGSRNVNGLVNLETKFRAANLDSSSNTMERFFASRFKENNGDLDRTVAQLNADLAAHPNDETIKKTLAFAQDSGNKFTYEPPKAQTSNYVVFNDKLIDIVKKYGLAGLVAGGASHFSTVPVDHQPDFPDQNGMADGGTVDDATDAPTDPNNSIAPLATALNQAVPNFDPEAAGFRPSTNIEDVRNKPLWRKAIEVITRKPLPGDLTNYAKGGSVKATKTQANYRGGTAKKRCGICSMFVAPSGCTAVRGVISARALCDFFERKAQERANGGRVDAANIEHEPSEAQKEAGNYAKDHVRVHGLDITIENAKGGYRRGVGHDGKPWSVKMPAHYGYIKGTIGKDKDHVDVYLGPHLKSPTVFVVDQVDHETKKFDEHKAFLGFASPRQVMDTYQKAFSDGKAMQRLGHLTGMSIEEFKNWLATGDMKKKADDHFADAVKIDATHDGPWMSCMSIDGATMYRNKNLPATANIKGETVDVDDMLLHHEVPERADLEKLIAEFKARFKREPNKNERKAIYLKAHNRSGTPNERTHAKKIDVDWKAWSAWCRGEESKIEKMKFTNQPKDADVKPIPHSHEELEAMDHASAA